MTNTLSVDDRRQLLTHSLQDLSPK